MPRSSLPRSETSRLWTMNFFVGLFPSNPGTQLTFMVRGEILSTRLAITFIGANGNSITLRRADRSRFVSPRRNHGTHIFAYIRGSYSDYFQRTIVAHFYPLTGLRIYYSTRINIFFFFHRSDDSYFQALCQRRTYCELWNQAIS